MVWSKGKDDDGLIYLRARYYNPQIGQFIQLDENRGDIENVESQNRYAFAMQNPNKYIDKDGRAAMMMSDGGGSSKGIFGGVTSLAEKVKEEAKKVFKKKKTSDLTSQDRYNLWNGSDTWDNWGGKPKGVYATKANYDKARQSNQSNRTQNNKTSQPTIHKPKATPCKILWFGESNTLTYSTIDIFSQNIMGVNVNMKLYTKTSIPFNSSSPSKSIFNFSTNTNLYDNEVEKGISLLGTIGASIAWSWTNVKASIFATIARVTMSIGVTISYNLLFGQHGLSASFEYEQDNGFFIGLDASATASGLHIILAALALYACSVPVLTAVGAQLQPAINVAKQAFQYA